MRRCVEQNDLNTITEPNVRAGIHNMWMHKWLRENLTSEQQQKTRSEQKSIVAAWLRNQYGSKRFVMAIIETGLSWAAPSGATEHTHSGAASSAEHSRSKQLLTSGGAPDRWCGRWLGGALRLQQLPAGLASSAPDLPRAGHREGPEPLGSAELLPRRV